MAKNKNRFLSHKSDYDKKAPGGFFRTLVRGGILASALGVVGTGYHHYGTDENVTATVTSVEQATVEPGETPYTIIHTDQGTFINEKSFLHLKFTDATQQIDKRLQPGAKVSLSVYGVNPTIGSIGPHTFGFYRNVIAVNDAPAPVAPSFAAPTPITTAPPATTPQPVPAPAPTPAAIPAPAGLRTVDGVVPGTDLTEAQSCVDTDQLDEMRTTNPQIYRDLALMERLPLTGLPVFQMIVDPKNMIRTCLTPYDKNNGTSGTFSNSVARVERGTESVTTIHEYFHALQYLRDKQDDVQSKLTLKDFAVATALREATSVGYSLMVEQEARNRGLTLSTATHGDTYQDAHSNEGNRAVFSRAYTAAYTENPALAPQDREAAALQAGGQAVVKALMLGDDADWLRGYSYVVVNNMNANTRILSANTDTVSGYKEMRNSAFANVGKVSDKLNIIPREFTGNDAKRYIDRCVDILGIRIGAPKPAASAPAPGV